MLYRFDLKFPVQTIGKSREFSDKISIDLHNILWVVLGVVFIHLYNKRRPDDTISLSGQQYLFALVFIASVTWLPAEFIAKTCFAGAFNINPKTVTFLIAIVCAFILFFLVQWKAISRWIFLSAHDNFYKKCVEWENKEILLTLKNGKAYHCLLWIYPENPKSRPESQTISIVPFKSGYRSGKTKKIIWNNYYPEYRNKFDLIDMELIIPRTEIVTFGKFNRRAFEHFRRKQLILKRI